MNLVILAPAVVEKVDEPRYTQNNKRVQSFKVKTTETFKGKSYDSWHLCETWSEDISVRVGQVVGVTGKLKTSSWEQGGEKRYKTFVDVRTVDHLGESPAQRGDPARQDDDLPF